MKILGIILGIIAALIGGLLAVASMQPDTYTVERSRTYDAPPEAVWTIVGDYGRFAEWSPWQKYDPALKTTVEGKPATVGHKYTWKGNDEAGAGTQTITAVKPGERIDVDLVFTEPFAALATTSFILSKDGDKTRLTWSMEGKNDLMGKVASLLMDMEAMIGKDYEEGLANIDKLLAKPAS